jgi:DNA polymerase-3 subunit alpha
MPHFTHLHLHTDYSLLDGAISIDDLVAFGVKQNFKALGISDHGNIFGAVKFFQKAKAAGIKPVLGMEAYFTEDATIKNPENKYYHLILIVENEVGYKNLCKLISYAHTSGFYFKPRIDYAILRKHSEGLIVTSACLGGHIPQLLMNDQDDEAHRRAEWFLDIFGPERFYFEVQPDEQEDQKKLNKKIFELSSTLGVPVVATGDCHYVHAEDRYAHEVMLAVQTRSTMSDANRFTFGDCRAHMRTAAEMSAIFPHNPEVMWNSGVIADRCSFNFETGKLYFPQYPLPEMVSAEQHFEELCVQGLNDLLAQQRFPSDMMAEYEARLREEMALIIKMGFVTYFLVVSDFIRWAKQRDIPVGPGRGSAAGSLVAWALQITDIDPIRYHLLFERFLNPERISMPDIDIDFCIEGRDRVISYVRERYGHDHVCQIITFGTMMAKGVVKDVARALGFPFEDSQSITDLIPDQLKITLQEAIDQEPKLKQLIDTNPKVAELMSIAFRLEGLTRHASKHAAGIVITPRPVDEMLPVYIPPKTDELVTQFAMTELESLGFLKMDFLGLKNLTLIQAVIAAVEKNRQVVLKVHHLPLDDDKTFALLKRGDTSGVFQLESNGLKEVLRRLQPEKFEDIIAVNALYRPGPLNAGMVDTFIERRHGRQEITYLFPELEPILAETYGVIVYQEQVMHIASAIAGFSLGEADILRRAMGKKKADEMTKQKQIFVAKSVKRNFPEKAAAELFDLMAFFAGYGFNKSHSAAYALIAYQTAYLKAHYSAEFMAALISLETGDPETMATYLGEARSMGLTIMPPHINRSAIAFTAPTPHEILFGLQGIRNVGAAALESLLSQRLHKPFHDLTDLCRRIDLRTVNKRVLESLIAAGALDTLPGSRAQKQTMLAEVITYATEQKLAAATGQMTLFALNQAPRDVPEAAVPLPEAEEWSHHTRLEREKEVLGLYISGHPLDFYAPYITALTTPPPGTKEQLLSWCGIVRSIKTITTKKGDPMAFMQFEDYHISREVIIFPKVYKRVEPWLNVYQAFAIKGSLDPQNPSSQKIHALELLPLELVATQGFGITALTVGGVPLHSITEEVLAALHTHLLAGSSTLSLHLPPYSITAARKITVTKELVHFLISHKLPLYFTW